MRLYIITEEAPDASVSRLIELREIRLDGRHYVVTRTRDVNDIIELIAWESWASHDRETTILGERFGAVSMRSAPNGTDLDAFWGECDAAACRVIAAAFPNAIGAYNDGSFTEEAP